MFTAQLCIARHGETDRNQRGILQSRLALQASSVRQPATARP